MNKETQTEALDVLAELDCFEDAVMSRDYPLALKLFLRLLKASSVHRTQPDRLFDHLELDQKAYAASRLAAAAFQLFLDDGFQLSDQGSDALQIYARNFAVILSLTPFKNADHVIRHLVGQSESGKRREAMSIFELKKLFFLWSIYSDVILPFERFSKQYPEHFKYLLFNALTHSCYVSADVNERRNQLIALMAQPDFSLTLDVNTLAFAGPVWMYTAYAMHPAKHEAKVALNKAYRQWVLTNGMSEPALPAVRKLKDKPKLVVIVEQMTISHAVYRCYGKALQSLRQKFTVVGMGARDFVDDKAIKVFDDFVYFEPIIAADMKKNVGKINKQKADMIIYLSLGMQNMTVPMATLRLAPIQICLPAHPTTTRIPTIDYVISSEASAAEAIEFNEILLLTPSGSKPHERRVSEEAVREIRDKRACRLASSVDKVTIVIPSFAMKVNAAFIDFLVRVAARCTVPVEFNFAPYLRGISYIQFKAVVEKRLPGSVVHLPYNYTKYLEMIAECDLQITPFPFGNSNGNIDAVLVGTPIICQLGVGVEARIDAGMLRRMGLPEWSIAKCEQEYEDLAVMLINDTAQRRELADKTAAVDLNEEYFKTGKETLFLDIIKVVYQFHEALQAADKRRFTYDELQAFTQTGIC